MNVALIVLAVIFAVLIVVASIYFLVYFQHPDDKNVAWFPKIIVVGCLSLAAYNVFLLPLDVANQSSIVQNTDAANLYPVDLGFFIASCVIVIVIVPFTVFFYEGVDDSDESDTKPSSRSQLQYALKWTIPTMIFAGIAIGVFWYIGGSAGVPRVVFTGNLQYTNVINASAPVLVPNVAYDYCATFKVSYTALGTNTDPATMAAVGLYGLPCAVAQDVIWVTVSVIIYMLALTSFVGMILFSVFGGVGLIALPFDLIFGFLHRPKPIKQPEYEEKKKVLGEQAKLLMEAGKIITEEVRMVGRRGKSLFDKSERRLRKKEQEFRRDVMILEYHWRWLEDAYRNQGGNLILQVALFIFGIIGAVISGAWIVHIILYVVPIMLGYTYIALVLNSFLELVMGIPFIGIVLYSLIAFYLLFCVIKGNNKLGMRFVFLFSIHPMEVGETFMNSLLFNVGIILLCSISCVQFLTLAFYSFASYSAANAIFNIQIQNLKGLHYGWNVFVFVLLSVAALTGLYVIYKPYHKQRENALMLKFRA